MAFSRSSSSVRRSSTAATSISRASTARARSARSRSRPARRSSSRQPRFGLGCLPDPVVEVGEQDFTAFHLVEALLQLGSLRRDGLALGGDLRAEPLDLLLALPERLAVTFQPSTAFRLRALSRDEPLAPALEVGRELLGLALAALQLGGVLPDSPPNPSFPLSPCLGFTGGQLLFSLDERSRGPLELGPLVRPLGDLALHGREPAPLCPVQPQPAAQAALVLRDLPLSPVDLFLAPGDRTRALPQRLLEPLQLLVLRGSTPCSRTCFATAPRPYPLYADTARNKIERPCGVTRS